MIAPLSQRHPDKLREPHEALGVVDQQMVLISSIASYFFN
jgi:hypothetical protein